MGAPAARRPGRRQRARRRPPRLRTAALLLLVHRRRHRRVARPGQRIVGRRRGPGRRARCPAGAPPASAQGRDSTSRSSPAPPASPPRCRSGTAAGSSARAPAWVSSGWSTTRWSPPLSPRRRSAGWASCSGTPRRCRRCTQRATPRSASSPPGCWSPRRWGCCGLLAPMFLLWFSYDQQTSRAAEARLFAELARGQEQVTGQSIDSSARVVLTAAARLFGGADVELLLLDAEGPVLIRRRRVRRPRPGAGAVGCARPAVGDPSPWPARRLHRRAPLPAVLHCGPRRGREPARAPARSAAERRGRFGRREVTLAQVLVGQAEAWLSVADLTASRDAALDRAAAAGLTARALGDLGAHTAPSLHRPARVGRSAGPAGGVSDRTGRRRPHRRRAALGRAGRRVAARCDRPRR